jgi:hypothetical protein
MRCPGGGKAKQQVKACRALQLQRSGKLNSNLSAEEVETLCRLSLNSVSSWKDNGSSWVCPQEPCTGDCASPEPWLISTAQPDISERILLEAISDAAGCSF